MEPELLKDILPRVMAGITSGRDAVARRESHFVRGVDDPAGNRLLDPSVPLLAVDDARDERGVDPDFFGDSLRPAEAEPVLTFVPGQDYRCHISHELTSVGLRQSTYAVPRGTSTIDLNHLDAISQMTVNKGLAARMFQAQHHREGQLGHKLVLREIGEAVARAAGREDPVAPSVVRRWLIGQQEPRGLEEWRALATALAVDPGWLAFGEASAAPMAGQGTTPATAPDAKFAVPLPVLRAHVERAKANQPKKKRKGR